MNNYQDQLRGVAQTSGQLSAVPKQVGLVDQAHSRISSIEHILTGVQSGLSSVADNLLGESPPTNTIEKSPLGLPGSLGSLVNRLAEIERLANSLSYPLSRLREL